jgi:hypothetical protein
MGKAQHQREKAQLAALAQFYETHGFLPEGCGFEIVDDGFEPINTRFFESKKAGRSHGLR